MNKPTDLIPYTSISQMAGTWKQATADIAKAFQLLKDTETNLAAAFGEHKVHLDRENLRHLDLERFMVSLRQGAWRSIVDKSEIRRILSIKRAQEIDKQLENKDLPEITEEEIYKMLEGAFQNAGTFAEELVLEVFEYLRPHHRRELKTNQKFSSALGDTAILPWAVERGYGGGNTFRVNYHRDKEIRALDNVFHALDGKGFSASYHGELYDAITNCPGHGETQYFSFKCYKNNNLHLTFRRIDLVQKLNTIVQEHSLRPATATSSQQQTAIL